MERNPNATCETCPYWYKTELVYQDKGDPSQDVYGGDCRRGLPLAALVPIVRVDAMTDILGDIEDVFADVPARARWPQTEQDSWCAYHPRFWLADCHGGTHDGYQDAPGVDGVEDADNTQPVA